jgi:hypothetical protein
MTPSLSTSAVTAIAVLLFVGSIGIAVEIWLRAMRLAQFDKMLLSDVERRHPRLPSIKIVVSLLSCYGGCVVLAVVALTGEQTSSWLFPVCILALSGGASILSELDTPFARRSFAAITLGALVALVIVVVKSVDLIHKPVPLLALGGSLTVFALALVRESDRPLAIPLHYWPLLLTNLLWLLLMAIL